MKRTWTTAVGMLGMVTLLAAGCATGDSGSKAKTAASPAETIADRQRLMKLHGALWKDIQDKAKAGNIEGIVVSAEALALNPDRVLLSPGPCSPKEAGVTLGIINAFAGKKPIFGVCLGHQSIGHYFGGKVIRASRLMHGKTSPIRHKNTDVFEGMPQNFAATRYHSLLVERETFPAELEITADTAEGEVMGLRHKTLPIWGVQFHPESIATEGGMKILENFLKLN